MGIQKKHVPGCNCCACTITNDDGNDATCSGSFTHNVPGNTWTTSSSNGFLYFSEAAGAGTTWKVSADTSVAPGSDAGVIAAVRLFAGFDNCSDNNYVYVELSCQTTGERQSLSLWQIVGGNPQELARQDFTVGFGAPTLGQLELCWDGEVLTGHAVDLNVLIASRDAAPTGTLAGIATGTLAGTTTSVAFTDFLYEKEVHTQSNCDECPEHCCKGAVPGTLTIEIAGSTSATATNPFGCVFQCSDMIGTWFLVSSGDENCYWIYSLFPGPTQADCSGTLRDSAWGYEADVMDRFGARNLAVSVYASTLIHASYQVALWRKATETACDDVSNMALDTGAVGDCVSGLSAVATI